MSAFTTELKVIHVDGKFWDVLAPFEYRVGSEDSAEVVRVDAHFITDFASIPRFAWSIIGHPTGRYGKAAVVHDWLYTHPADGLVARPVQPRSRKRCDQIFLEGMKVLGVGWWKRSTMYLAVRVGGRGGWKHYRENE